MGALALAAGLAACETATAPAADASTRITLTRSPCFGFCPDYDVSIMGDGQVAYTGRRFVGATGERHGVIPVSEVGALLAKFDAAHFDALQNSYRANVSDLPTYRVTLERDGHTKTVEDYGGLGAGMPHAVQDLEDEIDRVANTASWVRRDPNAPVPR
jgi:hypothetical protein